MVAPSRLQAFTIEKIDQEIAHRKAGRDGVIIAKINGVLEPSIVQALYRASQAGVRIDIVCRGICALRPGLPGISETIRVISIVDRFLEHSRIFYFGNAGDPEVYVGSADWMDRNLSRRVEVLFPVEQPNLKQRLISEIIAISGRQRQGQRASSQRHLSGLSPSGTSPSAARRFLVWCASAAGRHAEERAPAAHVKPRQARDRRRKLQRG